MTLSLYHDAIVSLARAATGAGSLDSPSAEATVDNPLCGDRVTMQVAIEQRKVATIRHRVRGCLLCEAAASLIAAHAPGMAQTSLIGASDAVKALLEGRRTDALWEQLEIFAPVSAHKSRHRCVLLPFEALEQALLAARSNDEC